MAKGRANATPGTTYHRSNRHRNRDDGRPDHPLLAGLWDQGERKGWDEARELESPPGMVERYIDSFGTHPEAQARAYALGGALLDGLNAEDMVSRGCKVKVEYRPVYGWGVWLIREPK